jgi:deoxyribonuclease IV
LPSGIKSIVGAHLGRERPLEAAAAIGADCVQIFLSDPQDWRRPEPRDDAGELLDSKVPLYVHAPYPINVCSRIELVREALAGSER